MNNFELELTCRAYAGITGLIWMHEHALPDSYQAYYAMKYFKEQRIAID